MVPFMFTSKRRRTSIPLHLLGENGRRISDWAINLSREVWYLLGETGISRCGFSLNRKEDGAKLAWIIAVLHELEHHCDSLICVGTLVLISRRRAIRQT
jgi:hypothetical protein